MTRSRRISVLLIAFGAGWGTSSDATAGVGGKPSTGGTAEKTDYFQELQGSWKVVEQVENGRDISVEMRRNNWTITRTGDTYVLKSNLGFFASGTWTVDDTKDPVELTQYVKKGKGAGKARHLIVKLEGDVLYYCGGEETPDDFHSPPGKNLVNAKAIRMAVPGDKVQLAEKKAAAKVGGSAKSGVDIKALELRANAGDSQSMYDVGICYYFGKNVERDEAKGVAWVEKAAKAGHPGGMYSLATCYTNGIYVKKDFRLANEWLRKAANAGSPEAQKALARASSAGGWQAMSGDQKAKALGNLFLVGAAAAAALSSNQPAAGAPKSVCSGGGPFSTCGCQRFEEEGREGQEKFYCQTCRHSLGSHR
ncbi:uncharacterized domain TIGR03067 protein [Singulisphaera sp. GP187]|uniref:TIGR03067 domain-containing protein n=1 Tax=Singulisphaera sp. GP187 TaxID=1882752 RepID=UPI00092B170E|nr:TIGR03067 domain-containing protein [Singulisphaera sp. GP187]SIO64999.1 uncharacterized domain TIGR03067 protein [Singulisphaera sp. GP187]